jgi:hypothetical protein
MLQSKITERYERHNLSRLCQGDIFNSLRIGIAQDYAAEFVIVEKIFPYAILISQDCDLEQEHNARLKQEESIRNGLTPEPFSAYQPNVLLLPAFRSEFVKDGTYLKDIYDVAMPALHGDLWKRAKANLSERYHLLEPDLNKNVPELIIDFKNYLSVPKQNLQNQTEVSYLSTLNELFREDLALRFANYMSRIALPEITAPRNAPT